MGRNIMESLSYSSELRLTITHHFHDETQQFAPRRPSRNSSEPQCLRCYVSFRVFNKKVGHPFLLLIKSKALHKNRIAWDHTMLHLGAKTLLFSPPFKDRGINLNKLGLYEFGIIHTSKMQLACLMAFLNCL